MRTLVHLQINGREQSVEVHPAATLLEVLRDPLGLTGAKPGCEKGDCGACTVLIDGQPINACLVLALQAESREVVTVEGLGRPEAPHPLQRALAEIGVLQCGYCAPGMLLSLKALLDRMSNPSAGEVRQAIAGNLCRCGSYDAVVQAVVQLRRT